MIRLAPGSLPWLVWWDLRIRFRSQGFGARRRLSLILYGALIILLHAVAGFVLRQMFGNPRALQPEQVLGLNRTMLATLLFFMLLAAGLSVFRLIFAGRELTPLLSSPVPFRRVLWMRVLGLIATTWAISVLLVAPVADMGALLGHPVFLLAYPVTVAIAIIVVAAALLLMSLVLWLFGVRRARKIMQVMQAAVPVAFVLLSVFGRYRSPHGASPMQGTGLESLGGLMTVPARALTGAPLPLSLLLVLAALALVIAVGLARHSMLGALQTPDVTPRRRATGAEETAALHFRTSLFRVLLLKEWRTLLRDPRIATALLAQPVVVIPALYGGLMHGRFQSAGVAAAATFVAAQMSQYVANLMISAEEAPSLLGAAPQPRQRLIVYKCAAALLPILALLLLAAVWLASRDAWAGLVCAVCCFGAAFCACAVEVARPYPSPRRSFVQLGASRRKRDPLDILSVLMMQLGWTAGAWFLADRSYWGAMIVFGVILVPFFEWWRDANRQALLGY